MLNNNSYQHSIYKKAVISHKIVDRCLSAVELAGCLRIAANEKALCRWDKLIRLLGLPKLN